MRPGWNLFLISISRKKEVVSKMYDRKAFHFPSEYVRPLEDLVFENNVLCILKNVAHTYLLTFWGKEQKMQVLLQRNLAVVGFFFHLTKMFCLVLSIYCRIILHNTFQCAWPFFFVVVVLSYFLRLLLFFSFFFNLCNLLEFLKYPY